MIRLQRIYLDTVYVTRLFIYDRKRQTDPFEKNSNFIETL